MESIQRAVSICNGKNISEPMYNKHSDAKERLVKFIRGELTAVCLNKNGYSTYWSSISS
jgi:hypothetical protein